MMSTAYGVPISPIAYQNGTPPTSEGWEGRNERDGTTSLRQTLGAGNLAAADSSEPTGMLNHVDSASCGQLQIIFFKGVAFSQGLSYNHTVNSFLLREILA